MLPVYARSFIGIFVSPPFVSFPFPFTNFMRTNDALLFLVRHVYNLMLPVYGLLYFGANLKAPISFIPAWLTTPCVVGVFSIIYSIVICPPLCLASYED